jgi:Na+/melibiose symporter-like transporter
MKISFKLDGDYRVALRVGKYMVSILLLIIFIMVAFNNLSQKDDMSFLIGFGMVTLFIMGLIVFSIKTTRRVVSYVTKENKDEKTEHVS